MGLGSMFSAGRCGWSCRHKTKEQKCFKQWWYSRVAIAACLSAQLNKQLVSKSFLLPRHGRDLKCNHVHIFHLQHTDSETDSEAGWQTVRQTVRQADRQTDRQ